MSEETVWLYDGLYALEIEAPLECVKDVCTSGSNDSAVAYWVHKLRDKLELFDSNTLVKALKETGAWEDDELLDNKEANLAKWLWLAAWNYSDSTCEAEYTDEVFNQDSYNYGEQ